MNTDGERSELPPGPDSNESIASPELAEQVYAYCSANRLGDWASGVDPRDPANLGNPEDHTPDAEEPTIPRAYCENLDHDTATSWTKLRSSAWPCSVRIDSGWNCTP